MTDALPDDLLNAPIPESVASALDERGLLCPLPIVHLSTALRRATPGEILLVEATDEGFFPDLLRWIRVRPHRVVALRIEPGEPELYRAWVEAQPPA